MQFEKNWVYKDLCYIIPLITLRKTPDVIFYTVPCVTKQLGGVDKVIHNKGAKSPMIKGDKKHYWYMHPCQEDQLVVHQGKRLIELFSKKHGKCEHFEVTSDHIKHKGKIIFRGAGILAWPRKVFHRVHSPQGSISTNYPKHFKGFNIKTNFNIYDVNLKTGESEVVREGHKDQQFLK